MLAAAEKPCSVDGVVRCIGGTLRKFEGEVAVVTSPILTQEGERTVIGRMALMTEKDALEAVAAARAAWGSGQGAWPQSSPAQRIEAMERVAASLKEKRSEIVNVLMWEICKTPADAAAEFDRTMQFIQDAIQAYRASDGGAPDPWESTGGTLARVRRTAIGVVAVLGPSNYPLNETYCTLIPALLSGNVVVLKVPTLGGLVHFLTMESFVQHLPSGVMNFVSGSGRSTMGPMMQTGAIDALAFIGGSEAADSIIKAHPHPHRLKLFLQLEGKNLGIVLPDADLDLAAEQCMLGATAYCGQRCTAIKLIFVHESVADAFVPKLVARVAALKVGLPWEHGVAITPLPDPKKPAYLQALIADAVVKGASVVNAEQGGGGTLLSGSLMTPAVLYPVTAEMRVFREEQFGPVVPVAVFAQAQELADYYASTDFGQQAAVFTSQSTAAAPLIDVLATAVGRINMNTQCARSPDSLPFSGRRSSALGTMSVSEGLRAFSIETVVATKDGPANSAIVRGFDQTTQLLAPF